MRLNHSDKALGPTDTKLSPAAQAVYDRQTRNLALTDDERNEVGLAVAIAAEAQTANAPHRAQMRKAAEPSPEEAAELAAAQAACEPYVDAIRVARIWAESTAEEARQLFAAGYWESGADPDNQRRLAEARGEAARTERALNRAIEEAVLPDKRVQAAQAAILRGARARQIRVTRSW